jgi:hypothetical protein
MPRRPFVPRELTTGPFTLIDAQRAGLTRWHLRGKSWRRLKPGTYVWAGLAETPALKLRAALLGRPPFAVFSGRTAAWLHGLDLILVEPIETIQVGIADPDVVVRRGFRTISLPRTIFGLPSLVDAVVVADQALHSRLVSRAQLGGWIDGRAGRKGVRRARRVLEFADAKAESPMETRLRMLLVMNGLPRPELQVDIPDETGSIVGRLDLFYQQQRLGIEYDGETHRTSLVQDDRRQNRLLMAGIRLLRFTAADVMRRPDTVLSQVRDVLAAR